MIWAHMRLHNTSICQQCSQLHFKWYHRHPLCIITGHSTVQQLVYAKKNDALQWRHNERDGVKNHRRLICLLNCWLRHRLKKTSKLRVTGLCAWNSPATGEFPAQKASDAENVSIWWRHHEGCNTHLFSGQCGDRWHNQSQYSSL